MDNYYTRHALAKFLRELTDQKVRVIGTVKLTNVDALNTRNLEEACALLKNAPRGSWKLVAVYDPPPNLEDQRKEHAKEMRKRKRQKQTTLPFSPSDGTVAKNCGFVLFVDKKIVMIYTNDLSGTPSEKNHRWVICRSDTFGSRSGVNEKVDRRRKPPPNDIAGSSNICSVQHIYECS